MTTSPTPQWSSDVSQADWLKERLDSFMVGSVTSRIPTGYEAYARILHPVETPVHGDRLVRWTEVAKWSGVELAAQSQWIAVALPEKKPEGHRPWRSQGPHSGSLYPDDARALVSITREFTTTPEHCWCCIWDGYGMLSVPLTTSVQLGFPPRPPLIPVAVRDGPKVHTPYRDYFLYECSIDSSFIDTFELLDGHSPNLWWPADHAWFVGTEIYSDSTYIGGPMAMIEAILQCGELEAFEVESSESIFEVMPEWMVEVVDRAVDELFLTGRAEIQTAIAGIRFEFHRPSRFRRGLFTYEFDSGQSGGSGQSPMSNSGEEDLRKRVTLEVQGGLRGLVT